MTKRYLLGALLACLATRLFAQSNYNELGSWNILNFRYQLHPRWNLVGEAQVRSLAFYQNFHYYEIKGGAGYKVSDQVSLFVGSGTYQTYREGGSFVSPKVNDEFRLWSQVALQNQWGRVRIEHRYRLENRWTLRGYRNRFRYRLQAIVPLNAPKIELHTLYGIVWNELFLTDRATYFERNRSFIGLGYELSPLLALQSGWLRQFDYFVNDETGKNFFQISLLFNLRRRSQAPSNGPHSTEE